MSDEAKPTKDLVFTEKGDFWGWKGEMSISKNCRDLSEVYNQKIKDFLKKLKKAHAEETKISDLPKYIGIIDGLIYKHFGEDFE